MVFSSRRLSRDQAEETVQDRLTHRITHNFKFPVVSLSLHDEHIVEGRGQMSDPQ
jgi:hypothetical protein